MEEENGTNDIIAVNDEKMNSLISDSIELDTDIIKCLNDMQEMMSVLYKGIEGEVSDSISNKFSDFDSQFSMLIENIESYTKDFQNACKRFNMIQSRVSLNDVEKGKGGESVNVKY